MRHLRRSALLGLLGLCALLAVAPGASAFPGQRYDLKVLVLSANGNEPTFSAWIDQLEREGVPYDAVVAESAPPITTDQLQVSATHSRYEAVILANGGLVDCGSGTCESALSQAEWDTLNAYEAAFGIRQITAVTFPTPDYGLNFPTFSGSFAGETGTLSAAALAGPWKYLRGTVPFPDVFGWKATPVDPARFEVLLSGSDGSALMGVFHHLDGRDELVSTVDANQYMLHFQLLRHGMLTWATRGTFVGLQRNYLTWHVDDVFLGDDRWDPVANTTPEDGPDPIRMAASDVDRAVAWENATGQRLVFLFNGEGSDDAIAENGSDPLTAALLAHKNDFAWMNHTYGHMELSTATRQQIEAQIKDNVDFAARNGIAIDPSELVTGEHSGLHNPAMEPALRRRKVFWIGADNSREPNQYAIGTKTLTVPRHPTGVYYNVGTFAEQLDEYNYIYFDGCVPTPVTTCRTSPATYDEYVASETDIIMGHLVGNDPRPHYIHQANLAEDGTFYPVADSVLGRYGALYSAPLLSPSLAGIGQELQRQAAWAATEGAVTAYRLDNRVFVTSTVATDVPLTGTSIAGSYAGQASGWRHLRAGQTVSLTAKP